MQFVHNVPVRFAHIDVAGRVFYPRYFEMLNEALEEWLTQDLGMDLATLHFKRRLGIPLGRIECDFRGPAGLGDVLAVSIEPVRLGRSSCTLEYGISKSGAPVLNARAVMICVDLATERSMPWPDDIRLFLSDRLMIDQK